MTPMSDAPEPKEEGRPSKAGWDSLAQGWTALVGGEGRTLLWAVAILNLGLMFSTEFAVLKDYPNSGDEYAYLVSAQLFARGKLSVPSPSLPRFFDVVHVVNDGKFYGKYPPGWPLILSLGVLLGIPWAVNPLLGTAVLFAVRAFARRHGSTVIANIAVLSLLGNPFLIFTSASYFSHTSCLLFAVLAMHGLLICAEERFSAAACLGMGFCAGLVFLIRPFSAVLLFAAPAIFLLYRLARQPDRRASGRKLLLALLPFLLCLAVFFAYNRAQTGQALLQPFQKYAPWDAPSWPKDGQDWRIRAETHLLFRTWDLARWLPLSPLLVIFACCVQPFRGNPTYRVLIAAFISTFVGFFFYWGDGIIQYGPRYLFETLGFLVVLTGAVVEGFRERGLLAMAGLLILNFSTYVEASREVSVQIEEKRNVFKLARELQLSDAIVFLRTGSGSAPAWDCSRNGIDFTDPVLFVQDLGAENPNLLAEYPARRGYVYQYDAERRQGSITRMPDAGKSR